MRDFRLLEEATLQIRSDRRKFRPYGLYGGQPGTPASGVLNPDTDPKEMFNLFGRSGGVAVFETMMRDVLAPYMISIKKYPNKDYSKMMRSE